VPIYFPKFEEVGVYRNRYSSEDYVTLVVRGRQHPLHVEIEGEAYEYDEFGTDRTRMHMRVAAQKREDETSGVAIDNQLS